MLALHHGTKTGPTNIIYSNKGAIDLVAALVAVVVVVVAVVVVAVVVAVVVVAVVVAVVVVVVVVVVVYLKRLRIVLRCAKAGCGRRTSSS